MRYAFTSSYWYNSLNKQACSLECAAKKSNYRT